MITVYVVITALTLAGSFAIGMWRGYEWSARLGNLDAQTADLRVTRARQEAGRLSRKIFRQRLMIRNLKAQLAIYVPKKEARPVTAQPTAVSH